jgi:hypothetical protein
VSEVTRILQSIERGEASATDELLPLVYDRYKISSIGDGSVNRAKAC